VACGRYVVSVSLCDSVWYTVESDIESVYPWCKGAIGESEGITGERGSTGVSLSEDGGIIAGGG